jgi:hypothetical protein
VETLEQHIREIVKDVVREELGTAVREELGTRNATQYRNRKTSKTSKMWRPIEDALLLKHYPDIPKLTNLLGRTHKAIWERAYRHHHLRQKVSRH